ncbi:hypothetical protein BO226_11340 [Rhodococcus sp. 2G]|uniref:Uncharacterized protein n=1 Tax=Rhodococcus pyridinivorans TaxID=103816 RepID=A0A7M2XIN0_9NOCA|nr:MULTISPECIES: hypothetical protein [Rhodococcus]APE09727.1 hypothetical protein BO226_11340 [Rhodococcus sp. 2G]QOV97628.1 hypothetical protein INP59_17040 [Rhodococcus pyridinivorans]
MSNIDQTFATDITKCRTCRAEIVWASTTKGNAIPLEPEPSPNGNLNVYPVPADPRGRIAIVVTNSRRAALAAAGIPLYVSHFLSCPDAAEWRKQ